MTRYCSNCLANRFSVSGWLIKWVIVIIHCSFPSDTLHTPAFKLKVVFCRLTKKLRCLQKRFFPHFGRTNEFYNSNAIYVRSSVKMKNEKMLATQNEGEKTNLFSIIVIVCHFIICDETILPEELKFVRFAGGQIKRRQSFLFEFWMMFGSSLASIGIVSFFFFCSPPFLGNRPHELSLEWYVQWQRQSEKKQKLQIFELRIDNKKVSSKYCSTLPPFSGSHWYDYRTIDAAAITCCGKNCTVNDFRTINGIGKKDRNCRNKKWDSKMCEQLFVGRHFCCV